MNRPVLSICIPTYNRAGYLTECLANIVSQFDDKDIYGRIEVIISDNNSDDNTTEAVKACQEKYANISYSKNSSNLGYDRNVEKAIYLAQGDFIWTLSDDEFVRAGSLEFILNILSNYADAAWICIDNGDGQIGDVKVYQNGNDWLKGAGLAGGQLSQNIYNRKFLPASLEKYFGNLWIHYSLAREIAVDRKQLLVKNIFKPLESDHPCSWAGGGRVLTTFIKLKNIIGGLPSLGYDKKIVKKIIGSIARGLPRQISSAKINGLKINIDNYKLIIKNFIPYPGVLALATIVYLVPCKFLLCIKKLCLKK